MASLKRPSFSTQLILASLFSGLLIGLLVVFSEVSFAALIFSGELSAFVSQGIGLLLFGTVVIGVVVALTSSVPGAIAGPQDSPSIILAVVAAAIAGAMGMARPERTFATVVAAMILASVLTGIFFWLLGRFKLGQLVRFIPYPVVGGFLAGSGWLLVVGAIGVMSDVPFSLALLQPDLLIRWLPGLLFAILLLVLLRRFAHYLLMPALLLGGMLLFYLLLFLNGETLSSAAEAGWLLGPFPTGSLWQPVIGQALTQADWEVVFSQVVTISTIFLVGTISLLMSASSMELTTHRDVDLDRELRAAGIANIIASLTGSAPGFQSVSMTTLGYQTGAGSRLVGLVMATVAGFVLIFGAGILSIFPRVIAGGFLFYVGLSFLVEWVIDAYGKLPKLEYLLIWLILIVIATVGFLEGIAVGIILAAIGFVINYSRTKVTRFALSGADYQSVVMRPPAHEQLLHEHGADLYILELQGYIFFGSAHSFVEEVRQRVENPDLPQLRALLLDFRLVTGIDSSATYSFSRLVKMVQSHDIQLIFTQLSPDIEGQWKNLLPSAEAGGWQLFSSLDRGVTWWEELVIDRFMVSAPEAQIKPLAGQLAAILELEENVAHGSAEPEAAGKQSEFLLAGRLERYMQRLEVAEGECFLHAGQQVEGLYFIEEGEAIAKLVGEDGQDLELRRMKTGAVFGEIGIYSQRTATADVVASRPGVVLYLTAKNLKRMEVEDPQLALAFHRLIAGILGEKLAQTSNTVRVLMS